MPVPTNDRVDASLAPIRLRAVVPRELSHNLAVGVGKQPRAAVFADIKQITLPQRADRSVYRVLRSVLPANPKSTSLRSNGS